MKKFAAFLLALTLVLGLCACDVDDRTKQEEAPAGLQIGFAREKVMPESGTKPELEGTAPDRIMTSFMDYLTVTCVAVKGENGETVLLYTMDRLTSGESWTMPIRKKIAAATGIAEDHIMMASTHTHSAPKFSGWDGAEKYLEMFTDAMVKVGEDSLKDLTGAEVYIGSTEAEGLAFVRQYKLQDGTVTSSGVAAGDPTIVGHAAENDEELQIVRFTREGKKDVILMSFNAHPTYHGGTTDTLLSADFPAMARDHIESQGDYLVAYFTGDAGNQAPTTKYGPEMAAAPKDYKEHGQRLGQYLLDALPTLTKAEGSDVKIAGQQYVAKSNKERLDMLVKANEVMSVYSTQGRDAANALAAEYGLYQYLEASAIRSRAAAPDTNEAWLNVMSIGDQLSFAFAPYEMFSENGSKLRADTPYDMTFLVTCCNAAEGYLPSKAACDYGCYEYYITLFEVGTAEIFIDEFLSMLTQLKNP